MVMNTVMAQMALLSMVSRRNCSRYHQRAHRTLAKCRVVL